MIDRDVNAALNLIQMKPKKDSSWRDSNTVCNIIYFFKPQKTQEDK